MAERKRQILIATDVTVPGGVDRFVIDLVQAARDAGYAVSVLVESSSDSAIAAAMARLEIEVHRGTLYHRRYPAERIAEESRRILGTVQPDVLHVACGVPWSCLVLRETAVELGLETLVTEGYIPDDPQLSDDWRQRILALYASSRRVIFVSEGNRREMKRALGWESEHTQVIPNSLDVQAIAAACPSLPDRRRRAERRWREGSLRLLSVGRLTPQKGIDLLIEALGKLGPASGLTLDLYGDGPERADLEQRCRQLGLADRVRFLGWQSEIVPALAGHDLFVMPSRSEGMPYALLEAMASGIPILATAVPGIVEALDGGRVGQVVPCDDVEALSGALASWPAQIESAFRRAEAAMQHAAARHDLHLCMAQTLSCWQGADG